MKSPGHFWASISGKQNCHELADFGKAKKGRNLFDNYCLLFVQSPNSVLMKSGILERPKGKRARLSYLPKEVIGYRERVAPEILPFGQKDVPKYFRTRDTQ